MCAALLNNVPHLYITIPGCRNRRKMKKGGGGGGENGRMKRINPLMDLSFSESECGINEEEKTGKLVKAALELYDVVPQVSIKGNEAELLSGKPIPKAKIGATKRGENRECLRTATKICN